MIVTPIGENAVTLKHIEHRPADTGEVDHQLRLAAQRHRAKHAGDMTDNAGVWRAERQSFEVSNLKDRRGRRISVVIDTAYHGNRGRIMRLSKVAADDIVFVPRRLRRNFLKRRRG